MITVRLIIPDKCFVRLTKYLAIIKRDQCSILYICFEINCFFIQIIIIEIFYKKLIENSFTIIEISRKFSLFW